MSTASVALPRARARIRVLRRRAVVIAALATAFFAGYTLWFRDSSLVAVKTVKVEGIGDGKLDSRLSEALTRTGMDMTTLHVSRAALVKAARPFPSVRAVSADPTFPSTLSVKVSKRVPIATIGDGSGAVGVAGDGRIMRGVPLGRGTLPTLPLSTAPKGAWLGGSVLEQAQVLGAAPKPLLRYVDHTFNGDNGVGVELDGGVDLLFVSGAGAAEKWGAAAAVLSDSDLGPLDYVDLSVPRRPAVGGVSHSPPPLASG
jgi:cell division septal protein FtsQ